MTADLLVSLPIIIPLSAAAVCGLFWLAPRVQRIAAIAGMALLAAASVALLLAVAQDGAIVSQPGGWAAPFGISLVGDPLAAALVTVAALLALAVSVFALRDVGMNELRGGFYPLFCGLVTGVNGAFLTGDVFNIYVWFEILLICAIGLMVARRGRFNLDGALKYAALNLFGTILFLMGVAFLYGATGTLNLADLAARLPEQGGSAGLNVALALFLLSLAVKAGLFPLFFWLPLSYHTPPAAVSAVFAGLVTKVGVYVAFRIFILLFDVSAGVIGDVLVWVAAITMLTGAAAAFAQTDIRRILAFLIVSGMGYLMVGFALGTPEAIAATTFYLIHDIMVKGAIFMLAGAVVMAGGSSDLRQLGGLIRTHPVLATLFLMAGLSLAGLPIFSGFWGKVLIVDATIQADRMWLAGVALFTGLITTMCVVKIWMEAFWKDAPGGAAVDRPRLPLTIVGPAAALVAISALIGVYPQPVIAYSELAAEDMADPAIYSDSVLNPVQGGQ